MKGLKSNGELGTFTPCLEIVEDVDKTKGLLFGVVTRLIILEEAMFVGEYFVKSRDELLDESSTLEGTLGLVTSCCELLQTLIDCSPASISSRIEYCSLRLTASSSSMCNCTSLSSENWVVMLLEKLTTGPCDSEGVRELC